MVEEDQTQLQQTGEWGGSTMEYTQAGFQEEKHNTLTVIEGPSTGQSKSFGDTLLVGRHPDCDLQLDDNSVSREHLRIERKGKNYVATNLNSKNFTLLNGKKISSAAVKDGAILTLGASKLRLNLHGAGGAPKKSSRVRVLLLALVLVGMLVVLFAAIGSKDKSPEQSGESVLEQERAKETEVEDASVKRAIAVHLINGKRFMEQGNYAQALERFEAVLQLVAQHPEAGRLAVQCRQKAQEKKQVEEKRRQEVLEKKQKVAPLYTEANVLYSTKDYAGARAVLQKALDISPNDKDLQALRVKVEEAYQLQQEAQSKQQKRTERIVKRIRKSITKAEQYETQGQPYRALKEYEYILGMGAKGPEIDAIKVKVKTLQQDLENKTQKDFAAGQKLAAQEKYEEAILQWRKVLVVYPDHPAALDAVQQLMPMLEKQAKEFYQQGLVYEDLGQTGKAVKSFQQAMEVLSINPKNEYYRKAEKKLQEHGAL